MSNSSCESTPLLPANMKGEDLIIFLQHDDPDVVIPDHISRYLVYSAHLFTIAAILSFVYDQIVLGVLLSVLYLTSIVYWHSPRFSSWARRVDYCAVLSVVIYGTYLATTLPSFYEYIWFAGISLISAIFCCNEYCYYVQVMKSVTGSSLESSIYEEHIERGEGSCCGTCCCLQATQPNTQERDDVYWRTVITHLIGVHLFGFSLACILVVMSYYYPEYV